MGGGGMFPNQSYPNDNIAFNRPYYNQGGYSSPRHMSPYNYPPNYGMGYGRGFQRPYSPMNNYGPTMNGFQRPRPPINNYGPTMNGFLQNIFPNQLGGRDFFSLPRSTGGGLQSVPPSAGPNGNIQLNRPGEHRPHFDEQ